MLVLARGVGQSIELCHGEIKITVLSITGSIVRLGFEAPKAVDILRQEVAAERRKGEDHG